MSKITKRELREQLHETEHAVRIVSRENTHLRATLTERENKITQLQGRLKLQQSQADEKIAELAEQANRSQQAHEAAARARGKVIEHKNRALAVYAAQVHRFVELAKEIDA